MTTLESWTVAACAALGIDPPDVDLRTILDLARDVAHQVDRPAAPLTAYLLGLAVGAGQSSQSAVARLQDLAATWEGRQDDHPEDGH